MATQAWKREDRERIPSLPYPRFPPYVLLPPTALMGEGELA